MSSGCIKVLLAMGILTLILSAPQAVKEGLDDSAILDVGQRLGSVEAKVAGLETQVGKYDPDEIESLKAQVLKIQNTLDETGDLYGKDADEATAEWAKKMPEEV
jgi:hypothetical protein